MKRQDTSGDYGYDLAHQDADAPRTPDRPTGPTTGSTPRAAGKDDRDEDISYDEAHDF
ncbi:MAG TPA: hypothetical protein VHF92_18770 [Geodermatophilus sp.]|nr:hypothetical protein [Geodermatophilus sp.]